MGRKSRRRITDSEWASMVESYRAGEKVSVICVLFDIDQKTLWRRMRRAGEPARKCGNRPRIPVDTGDKYPYIG
jgi:transposase-like protein